MKNLLDNYTFSPSLRYDKKIKKYFEAHKRTDFCNQLTLLFGWFIDPNALGKRMRKKSKK